MICLIVMMVGVTKNDVVIILNILDYEGNEFDFVHIHPYLLILSCSCRSVARVPDPLTIKELSLTELILTAIA